MSTYRLAISTLAGALLDADLPWQLLSYSRVLNGPGGLEATFALADATGGPTSGLEHLLSGQRELRVYRDDVLVWGGYLWAVKGEPSPTRQEMRIAGQGWWSRVRRSVPIANLVFVDDPQQDIAWGLVSANIAEAGGDYGFSQGTHTGASVNRTRRYCERDHPNLADAVEELAATIDGFDFDLAPDKTFDTWTPRRGTASGVTLSPDLYVGLTYEEDASEMVTRLISVGDDECANLVDDRSNAVATYGLLMDVLDVESDEITEVEAHGEAELALRSKPRFTAEVTYHEDRGPVWGSYDLGDTLTLQANRAAATFSRGVRLVAREVLVQLGQSDIAFVRETLEGT